MMEQETIARAAERLLRAAPGSKVILFGSHVRGEAAPDSDLDFLAVEPQVKDRHAEMVRLRRALRGLSVAADVLVVSDKVFQEWRDTPNTVIYEAAREGKLYEQSAWARLSVDSEGGRRPVLQCCLGQPRMGRP